MVIFQANQISLSPFNNSNLASFGNTLNFPAPATRFENASTDLTTIPQSLGLFPFAAAENYLFQDGLDLYQIYDDARATIALYNPENTIHFIYIHNNTLDSLELNNLSNVLSISNFQLGNSSTIISNNTVTNLTSNGSANFVSAKYLTYCFVVHQMLSGINSMGYFILTTLL